MIVNNCSQRSRPLLPTTRAKNQRQHAHWVRADATKHVKVPIDATCVDLVKQRHPHKRVEDEGEMLGGWIIVRFRRAVFKIEPVGPTEEQCKAHDDLVPRVVVLIHLSDLSTHAWV